MSTIEIEQLINTLTSEIFKNGSVVWRFISSWFSTVPSKLRGETSAEDSSASVLPIDWRFERGPLKSASKDRFWAATWFSWRTVSDGMVQMEQSIKKSCLSRHSYICSPAQSAIVIFMDGSTLTPRRTILMNEAWMCFSIIEKINRWKTTVLVIIFCSSR